MNLFLSLIFNIFIILFTGLSFIFLTGFIKKESLYFKLAIAFGTGISLLTFEMMLFSFLNIPWKIFYLFTPWLIVFIYSCFKNKYELKKSSFKFNVNGIINNMLFIGILLTCFYVIYEASVRPVMAFDGWANWFLGGKAFYLSGFIDPSYIKFADNSNSPILNLLISLTYLSSGLINDQAALVLISLFFIATIIVFYFSASKFMSQKFALLFTLLLALSGNLIRHGGRFDVGNADLPLGFFIFCSSITILMLYKKFNIITLVFFNLFITSSALIKTEGIPIYFISQFIVFIIFLKSKNIKIYYYLITIFGASIILTWYVFKQIHNLPENPFFQPNINFSRIPIVIFGQIKEYLNFSRWNLLWIAFFLSLLSFYKNKYSLILGLICISQLLVYFIIYLTTPLSPLEHINSSYDRLLLHLAPTAMLMIAINFNYIFNTRHKS